MDNYYDLNLVKKVYYEILISHLISYTRLEKKKVNYQVILEVVFITL